MKNKWAYHCHRWISFPQLLIKFSFEIVEQETRVFITINHVCFHFSYRVKKYNLIVSEASIHWLILSNQIAISKCTMYNECHFLNKRKLFLYFFFASGTDFKVNFITRCTRIAWGKGMGVIIGADKRGLKLVLISLSIFHLKSVRNENTKSLKFVFNRKQGARPN